MGKYDHRKHDWLKLAVEIVIVIILALLALALLWVFRGLTASQ